MARKPTYDQVRQIFSAARLELLSNEYKSRRIPLAFRCGACGYVGKIRLGDLRKGSGCRRCAIIRRSKARKLDFNGLKKELHERGIAVLSRDYVNSHTKCSLRCLKCDHKWKTTLNHIRRGSGCPHCYHLRAPQQQTYTDDFIRKKLAFRQIKLISDYQTSKKPIHVRFEDCGHEVWTTWNQIQTGHECSRCAPNARATKQDYHEAAARFGGRVLEIGLGAQRTTKWECNLGHVFMRSLTSIRSQGTFCTVCSGSYAEMLCRSAVEKLFGVPFHRPRISEMRSPRDMPLELDIYNDELKIAVEHHGCHHYEPQGNWNGANGLKRQRIHDRLRRKFCKAKGILLVEVRELGKRTSLEAMRCKIRKALLRAGREIPRTFDTADLAELPPLNESQIYWAEVKQAARKIGLVILKEGFLGADTPIPVRCAYGHFIQKRPRAILGGHGCDLCYMARIKKPVQLSDGRIFESGVSAAKALRVTKEAVNSAVRRNGTVRGLRLTRIAYEEFLRHLRE